MSVVVNTNTQSIFAQRALGANTLNLQRNIERLSTGFRINRAADDAAGLSISEKLTARINGFNKAKQNASDGISLVQTAEGSLGIIQDNFQRIRELLVQGINGTNSVNEKNAIQNEINERIQIITDIGNETEFNGIQLLTGRNVLTTPPIAPAVDHNIVLQTGADAGQITNINFSAGTATARSGINVDITQAVGGAANSDNGELIEDVVDVLGGALTGFSIDQIHVEGATVNAFDGTLGTDIMVNPTVAGDAGLDVIDIIIDNVSRMRSELGATQNALESKITYLDTAMENAAASRSRIKDVDVAMESSMLVKNQILQQSASAMLSQANQMPQIALQLIGGR
jgi:flagellin